jgi:1-phosphatidylinositol-4-phosphate 5-kinase
MPSVLAEDPIPRTVNTAAPATKRSSYERRSSSSATRRDDDLRPNGHLSNGISDGMSHLPNGHRNSEDSVRYRPAYNGTSIESRSKRNSKHSQSDRERFEELPIPERLAPRDDGYFAGSDTADVEEGFFSTRVRLDVNGNGSSSRVSEDTVSRETTVLHGNSIFTEPEKATAVDRAPESRAPDGSLRVPTNVNQVHRISAPPAFSNQPSQVLVPQQPPRLQHRHTLEVPRGSSSRLSRDTAGSGLDGDVISASGRFSPATPTRRRASVTLVRRVTRSLNSDLHLDEVSQDLEAAQYAEMVRQKRMSRRKRKEEEEEDRVLVGTKVDQNHANYVMAYNMLTGIRFTVSRTNAKMDRELTDADFDMKHKFSFDM